mgnify:CR=1 FL=1
MGIDERDEAIGDGAADDGRPDIRRPHRLIVAAGKIEADPVALLVDDDVDSDGEVEAYAVVIDEALELAREFAGDDSVAFINGVLDAVRRDFA